MSTRLRCVNIGTGGVEGCWVWNWPEQLLNVTGVGQKHPDAEKCCCKSLKCGITRGSINITPFCQNLAGPS